MLDVILKSFESPDETRLFEKGKLEIVRVGGMTVGRASYEPGWRWSEHVKPVAGTELCMAPHQQYQLSGRLHVVLADGTELPADLVVYATGYGSMNGWAADLISQEVADRVGKVWGLGSDTTKDPGPWEGEQRNMWKPTQQEALWFHGGNLHQSRHYSSFLALQLKARYEGIPTPVHGLPPVHHLR